MVALTLPLMQLISGSLAAVANFFLFVATITPAWQVAEDTDAHRYVQSGLWMYCPGSAQCWYLFSDNAINYYEKVEICRFLLIGDCRQKLLRTPYFFGWHYAVFILNVITMVFLGCAAAAAFYSYYKKDRERIATIVYDVFVFMAGLFLTIALFVFMVNGAMLESKYLIGVQNTFLKEYGYSFYLACLSLFIVSFAMLAACTLTTYTFFFALPNGEPSNEAQDDYRASQYYQEQPKLLSPAMRDVYMADGNSVAGFQTPMRSITPMSQLPPVNAQHGEFISDSRSPNGDFKQTTRHFYSY